MSKLPKKIELYKKFVSNTMKCFDLNCITDISIDIDPDFSTDNIVVYLYKDIKIIFSLDLNIEDIINDDKIIVDFMVSQNNDRNGSKELFRKDCSIVLNPSKKRVDIIYRDIITYNSDDHDIICNEIINICISSLDDEHFSKIIKRKLILNKLI